MYYILYYFLCVDLQVESCNLFIFLAHLESGEFCDVILLHLIKCTKGVRSTSTRKLPKM